MTLMETPDLTSKTARMLLFGSTVNEQYNKTIDGNLYSVRIFRNVTESHIKVEVYSHKEQVAHLKLLPTGTRLPALNAVADKMIEEFEK